MNKLAFVSLLALVAGSVQAQTVSRSDLVPGSVLNYDSGLANAPSTTLTFSNDGATFLVMRNGTGSPVTVRVVTQSSEINVGGFGRISLTDLILTVPSSSRVLAGPFPTNRWNDAAGLVTAQISATTGISATAVRAAQ